jgi:uncharacterized protein
MAVLGRMIRSICGKSQEKKDDRTQVMPPDTRQSVDEAQPPRGRHRRLSNVRRLLRALGLMSQLVVISLCVRAQPASSVAVTREEFARQLVAAAVERPRHDVTYDPGYVGITYPGGDVPADSGVCSDEIIRIYRAVGVDLQKEVHEDIVRDPSAYPLMSRWRQKHPDRNIDHRRVANLMVFFSRKGEELPVSSKAKDYLPGDLVTWDLANGAIHIGMIVDQKALLTGRYKIVHNIGAGPKMEDVLFDWKITGHYRYYGPSHGPVAPAARAQSR